ncbi:E3 ubiquitin-protein ligase TRIM56 [Fasciolopsis buskii]|uniref:E3 ubiquitin-protein ligase TRIM56 n=1 Tax=Fasciolopsis buskii TaxID=27845 RepID=A0A8E0S0F8_9TREM|nr:E3 ubiquitin-protein ligase TRIM56 [Fasciolopsis buski]
MEIRKSLEANFLTCKHCQQPYRKPKVLVCLHTFCQSCLEELWAKKEAEQEAKEIETAKRYLATSNLGSDYRSGGYRKKWSSKFRYGGGYDTNDYRLSRYNFPTAKDKRIACPVCEKETVLPAGGVSELPTDQLADKLASMVDRMPTFPVCDVCTKQLLLTDSMTVNNNHQSAYSSTERYGSTDDSSSMDENDNGSDVEEAEPISSVRKFNQTGSLSSDSGIRSGQNHLGQRSTHSSRQRFYIPKKSDKNRRRRKLVSASAKPDASAGPQPASAACLECAKRLCTSCRETHSKMSVTSNHVLIRVEQMDDLQCSRHPRELRRFFCLTCRTYICIVCTFEATVENGTGESPNVSGHADHDILSIRQAVTAYQDQLSRDSAATQAQVNQIETLLSSLQACETEMQRLYTAIDVGAKSYIDQIHRQQVLLRDKVDKAAGVSLTVLSSECNRLTKAANNWYEFLNDERITSRLDLMDPLEALTEGGPVLDRVDQCLQAASEPLSRELAKQQFLAHLEAAEETVQNGDSGLVSSQSLSPPGNEKSAEPQEPDDNRAKYWRTRLGKFQQGKLEFGRIVTDKELTAEAIAEASRRVSTHAQTGPELIKALPPPKGAQRHRAVQIDFLGGSLEDCAVQTEPVQIGMNKPMKFDVGTQYQSSDINPPVSMYRSMKQILVQK